MGSISVDGPGQHNLDRSEDPWGNAGNRMHGGAPANRVPRLRTRHRRWQRGARRAEANRTTRVELAVDGKAPSEITGLPAGLEKIRRPEVCPGKASVLSGRQSHQGKSQNLVAWIAERRETEFPKPIDKAIFKDGEQVIGP